MAYFVPVEGDALEVDLITRFRHAGFAWAIHKNPQGYGPQVLAHFGSGLKVGVMSMGYTNLYNAAPGRQEKIREGKRMIDAIIARIGPEAFAEKVETQVAAMPKLNKGF